MTTKQLPTETAKEARDLERDLRGAQTELEGALTAHLEATTRLNRARADLDRLRAKIYASATTWAERGLVSESGVCRHRTAPCRRQLVDPVQVDGRRTGGDAMSHLCHADFAEER